MGRSSEFDDHIVEATREYLATFADNDEISIPTRAGLSLHIGVSKSALDTWEKSSEHPEGLVPDEIYSQFKDELNKLRAMAEDKLIKRGLTGDYNAAITKLMLTKHGYSDRVEQKIEADLNVTDMTDEQLNQKLEGLINAGSSTE